LFLTAILAALAFGLAVVGCDIGGGDDDSGRGVGTKVEVSAVPPEIQFHKAGNKYFRSTTDMPPKSQVSSDGATWADLTYSEPNFSVSVSGIVSVGGKYVTRNGHSSPDGITWYRQPGYSTNVAAGAVGGSECFIMVGTKSGDPDVNEIFWSTTGVSWTGIPGGGFSTTDTLNDVVFGGGKFVAVGQANGKAHIAYAATTYYTWTPAAGTGIDFAGSGGWQTVRYLGDKFIAYDSNGHAAYSADGAAWTMMPNDDHIPRAFGGGKYVHTGVVNAEPGIWYSSNLATWQFAKLNETAIIIDGLIHNPVLQGFSGDKFYIGVEAYAGGFLHYITVDPADLN
jgi:hypothetical protein